MCIGSGGLKRETSMRARSLFSCWKLLTGMCECAYLVSPVMLLHTALDRRVGVEHLMPNIWKYDYNFSEQFKLISFSIKKLIV